MAFTIDEIRKENNGVTSTEPIMVNITLAEYRSLVEENTRYHQEIGKAHEEMARLDAEIERLKRGVHNG